MGRPNGGTNKTGATDEKIRILNRYLNHEGSQYAIANDEGISRCLLSGWISKYNKGGYEALENKKKPGNPFGVQKLFQLKSLV